jgi:hypothetical protein
MIQSIHSKLLVLLVSFTLLLACKQEKDLQPKSTGTALTLTEARQWFESNAANSNIDQRLRTSHPNKKKILWEYAKQPEGNSVIVPIIYDATQWSVSFSDKAKASDSNSAKSDIQAYRLLLSKDEAGSINAQLVQVIGDPEYLSRQKGSINADNFSGMLLAYDLNNQLMKGYRYSNGKPISTLSPLSAQARTDVTVCSEITIDYYYTVCYTTSGVEHCETRLSFQEIAMACIDDGNGGGGGGGITLPLPGIIGGGDDVLIPSTTMYLPGQDKSPIDISKYLNCFGGAADASYQITLYVEEPNPGTGETKNGLNVGHSFIGFKQNGSGGTIEQVVGFYPNEISFGWVRSKMVDNGSSYYSVSATFNVTYDQFMAAVNVASGLPNQLYNISDYNCTDAAFAIFDAMGIQLPKTATSFPLGSATGHSPGRLGYDLRNSQLPISTTAGNASGSNGPCL